MLRKLTLKNPFMVFFVYFALICCLVLGGIFLFLSHSRENKMQTYYMQEKIELLLQDFELQQQNFQEIALRLAINEKYHYSVLAEEKYNENILLQDFENYRFSSILTDELFLYYTGRSNIFHITGSTINLDVYLNALQESEKTALKNALANPGNTVQMVSTQSAIYILTPFKAGSLVADPPRAILGCVIPIEKLARRFEAVSGGLDGTVALYADGNLLYCNEVSPPSDESGQMLTAVTSDLRYTISYLPDESLFSFGYSLWQISLIFLDVFLILILASLFANRAYNPLRKFRDKYRSSGALPEDKQYKNVLLELEDMIDHALQYNSFSAAQIAQIQELLKEQILRQLLNGTYSPDIQSCLDKLGIQLQGPFFYVICISFASEDVDEDFWFFLQKELELISTSSEREHVYTVCDRVKKQLWAICSLENRSTEKEITEYVTGVAESYSYTPVIGIGRVYGSLSQLSASWLESVDNLTKCPQSDSANEPCFSYEASTLLWLTDALSIGAKETALAGLQDFVQQQTGNSSVLMQRYIFAEFLGEISKLSRMNHIDLSNHSISLLIAANNLDAFHAAARELILDYCSKFHAQQQSKKLEDAQQICTYINEHFMDYDLSIEAVAENLNIPVATVRESCLSITGKMYKDYVTYLRMEYAKKLLRQQNLSVTEVCSAVGYSSVSYFIRLFKEATGMTPAKYMKSLEL